MNPKNQITLPGVIKHFGRRSNSNYYENGLEEAILDAYWERLGDFPVEMCEKYLYPSSAFTREDLRKTLIQVSGLRILFSKTSKNDSDSYLCEIDNALIRIRSFGREGTVDFDGLAFFVHGSSKIPGNLMAALFGAGFSETRASKDLSTVTFAYAEAGQVSTAIRTFDPIVLEQVEKNYTERVREQARELVNVLMTADHGLVILHGAVGTGKTYLIRALISELRRVRDSLVCIPPSMFLVQVGLLNQAVQNAENPLVILEDLGDMFEQDAKTRWSDHFSQLANMTDGLLSLLHNMVFLLTFNYDISKIDPALVRHGRCLMNIEVPRLTRKEAEELLQTSLTNSSYSLAEIFAMKEGKKIKETAPLGFRPKKKSFYLDDDTVDW